MRAPPQTSAPTIEAIDTRRIAALRLLLATSGLLGILVDPLDVEQVSATYAVLSLYMVYGALLYLIALRGIIPRGLIRWAHWIDVAWYLVLITLSQDTNSFFFFGFFLAILIASFWWSFTEGMSVTIGAATLFTLVGLVTSATRPDFDLNRFLIRPIYLLTLGYMLAYWGGHEITLKRRLALLKEIAVLSNPRFGVDYTLGMLVDKISTFFNAEICMLILPDTGGGHRLYSAGGESSTATHGEAVPSEMAQMLLAIPEGYAAVYNTGLAIGRRTQGSSRWEMFNITTWEHPPGGRETESAQAGMLGMTSLVTVPFRSAGDTGGRLYVGSRHRGFDKEDAQYLLHVTEHIMPVIQNIRLVDRLASDAAEEERQRIARDLHDSMIQPYIGLQMGLAAIRGKAALDHIDVNADLDRLYKLSGDVITDLRSYVRGLSGEGATEGSLLPAVRRFTGKFTDATGINVSIQAAGDMRVNDRLAAELFQMVAEGLSNIRKHTRASQATLSLERHDHHLLLLLENDNTDDPPAGPFVPRSITERALALGGNARVEQQDKVTSLVIEIPL